MKTVHAVGALSAAIMPLVLAHCGPTPPPPSPTTTVVATTAPPVTTVAPTTTRPTPAGTTTTTTTATPTTPPTTPAPPTTAAPTTTTTTPGAPATFVEDFARPGAFESRFDRGYSGEVLAGSMFGDEANDWQGDHDMSCASPNASSRVVHIDPRNPQPGLESQFYACAPSGDPAKAHLMTTVNTQGYNIAWFAPKQVFTDVTRVCWDQNLTALGGGKWTQVLFLTPAEFEGKGSDLGYTSPEFGIQPHSPSTPRGAARFGVKIFQGQFEAWQVPQGDPNTADWHRVKDVGPATGETTDKAPRYQTCVVDNGNGTLDVTRFGPNGGPVRGTVRGQIPDGRIRVVFADDNYNPDKHYAVDREMPRDGSGLYTWHWDNILIG